MKYLLKPDFEDIACLDDSLIGLLALATEKTLYYTEVDGDYSVLIDTKSTTDEILQAMDRYVGVVWKIREIKELTNEEYSNLLANYTPYTKSVFG